MDSTKERVEGTRATVIEIIGRTGNKIYNKLYRI